MKNCIKLSQNYVKISQKLAPSFGSAHHGSHAQKPAEPTADPVKEYASFKSKYDEHVKAFKDKV